MKTRAYAAVNLDLVTSPEPRDFNHRWRCEVAADVTVTRRTFHEPGEWQIENIEVVRVLAVGQTFDGDITHCVDGQHFNESEAMEWLTERMNDDRDDWLDVATEAIAASVANQIGMGQLELAAA